MGATGQACAALRFLMCPDAHLWPPSLPASVCVSGLVLDRQGGSQGAAAGELEAVQDHRHGRDLLLQLRLRYPTSTPHTSLTQASIERVYDCVECRVLSRCVGLGESTWDHPCDEYYRSLYDEEKKKVPPTCHAISSYHRQSPAMPPHTGQY